MPHAGPADCPPRPRPGLGPQLSRAAYDTVLDRVLHDLDASPAAAGECLDPILSAAVHDGTWDPYERRRIR